MRASFEAHTLGEIATGRTEFSLKSEHAVSYARAKHSRTVLNQIFDFRLRHDAPSRNPCEGTSRPEKPNSQVQATMLN